MMALHYKYKRDAKAAAARGDVLAVNMLEETSMFTAEYHGAGTYTVVGPAPYERKWFAQITVDANGILVRVS